jgi:hypothetical protein
MKLFKLKPITMSKGNFWKKRYFLIFGLFVCTAFIFFGAVMNFLVITENRGKMPIAYDQIGFNYVDEDYFTFHDKDNVKYWYLADIIPVVPKGGIIASLGDVTMFISLLIGAYFMAYDSLLFYRSKYGKPKRKM